MRRAAAVLLVAFASACGPSTPPPPPLPPPVPVHLEPACDLAPAAGLEWIASAKPRAIAEALDLIPALAMVLPEERLDAYAKSHGGIDLRQVQDLCVARYKSSTLAIARTPFDPGRVERAFGEKATGGVTRNLIAPNPPIVRLTGDAFGAPRTVTTFGREAVVLEEGKPAMIRAAEAFALGKLHRARPALKGAALERAVAELDADAPSHPFRIYAPGPFEGETAKGLGGLLAATTAIAASARPLVGAPQLRVRVVLMGAWGANADAAAGRLAAAAQLLADSAVGRLFGLDKPVAGPHVRGTEDALVLDATIDAMALARGIRDAVAAEVADILRR